MPEKKSFTDIIIKSSSTPINFVRSKDDQGRDCYFFIMCEKNKAEALDRDSQNDYIDFTKYGRIVASGFGAEPSDEVKSLLKDKYDFDADTLS